MVIITPKREQQIQGHWYGEVNMEDRIGHDTTMHHSGIIFAQRTTWFTNKPGDGYYLHFTQLSPEDDGNEGGVPIRVLNRPTEGL